MVDFRSYEEALLPSGRHDHDQHGTLYIVICGDSNQLTQGRRTVLMVR
jgi:hypothetical protein